MTRHYPTLEAARDAAIQLAIDTLRQDIARMHTYEYGMYSDTDRADAIARLSDIQAYADSIGVMYERFTLPGTDTPIL